MSRQKTTTAVDAPLTRSKGFRLAVDSCRVADTTGA
jgi:hypothetical protein